MTEASAFRQQIACRCPAPLPLAVSAKVSMFCHVATSQVLAVHDVSSLYHVPLLLKEQNLIQYLQTRLKLNDVHMDEARLLKGASLMKNWKALTIGCVSWDCCSRGIELTAAFFRHDRLFDHVNIVLVGKYTALQDSYTSVVKSLEHAALQCARKLNITVRFDLSRASKRMLISCCSTVGRGVGSRARGAERATKGVPRCLASRLHRQVRCSRHSQLALAYALSQGYPRARRIRSSRY